MQIPLALHGWDVTPKEAVAFQRDLAARIVPHAAADFDLDRVQLVAGADVAFAKEGTEAVAAVVVWDMVQQRVVEQQVERLPVRFPYVPGLLTFREAPVLLRALQRLQSEPEVVIFDGQGFAHPRRIGLASHLGLFIDRPTIGCAKSVLVGKCQPPPPTKGSWTALRDRDQTIGVALRSRAAVRPVYVSIGHRIDLEAAVALVLRCCVRYRLPEPTHLADRLVAREKAQLR